MMPSPAIRTLIVDDEPIARQILRDELCGFRDIAVVGEAENGEEAIEKIAQLAPDLVLLDLEMPGLGGFDVIHRLPEGALPIVILVTAYDQHAIRAFEAGAVDYLLKPISQQRLLQAVERARRIARNPLQAAENLALLQEIALAPVGTPKTRKIIGKDGEEFFLLNPAEVLAFQADGDLTWIITAKHRYAATQNLKAIEDRLRDTSFRRIHRNALVNVEQRRKMRRA